MPIAGLLAGQNGTFYGTTEAGGIETCKFETIPGCGTVFSLAPPAVAGGPWTETILHAFAGRPDGAAPAGNLIAQNGRLVGTTSQGGMNNGGCNFGDQGCGVGTVFTLIPPSVAGGSWTEKLLYKFNGAPTSTDGVAPVGALVASTAGVLYGITEGGDINNGGTVFDLVPPTITGGSWTEGILHRFHLGPGITDGFTPEAGLVLINHQLYGTTVNGGAAGEFGDGTVYSVTP